MMLNVVTTWRHNDDKQLPWQQSPISAVITQSSVTEKDTCQDRWAN